MCHNSGIESGEQQIERCVAHGMPSKAIKSVKYTMRKREKHQQQQHLYEKEQHQQVIEETEEFDRITCCEDTSSDSDSSNMDTSYSHQLEEDISATTTATENNTLNSLSTTMLTTALGEDRSKHNNNSGNIIKIPKLCGRFNKMQQQLQSKQMDMQPSSLGVTEANDSVVNSSNLDLDLKVQQQRKLSSMEPSMDDALAIGTQMTRKFAARLSYLIFQLQSSRLYAILTRTTQPAHLIAVCILSFVLVTVGPDLIENTSPNYDDGQSKLAMTTKTIKVPKSSTGTTLAALAYLGAFATHFGAQIWMTFVSGLSLYFSLPRHTFGQCQQILFPKYFALNAVLSISMLIIYAKYFWTAWTTSAGFHVCILAVTAFIEVVVRLYLVPPMLLLMHEKYKIEDAIGSGQEVGVLVQGDLVHCPHYKRIHKGFRRIHMIIAMGNMTVMLATCLQLYFLASKIHFS